MPSAVVGRAGAHALLCMFCRVGVGMTCSRNSTHDALFRSWRNGGLAR